MKQDKNLADAAAKIQTVAKKDKVKKPKVEFSEKVKLDKAEINPPHGEKSDFIKISITLPPVLYKLLMDEHSKRKIERNKDNRIGAIIRDALAEFLTKE